MKKVVMDSNRIILKKMLRIFIIYILIHTAACATDYGYESDINDTPAFNNYGKFSKQRYEQILSNLHDLFKEKSNDNSENKGSEDYNDLIISQNKNFDKQQLEEVLGEVTTALNKIKEDLLKFNKDGILTVEVPVVKKQNRYKRDVSNETVTNVTVLRTIAEVNITENSEATTEKVDIVTEKLEAVPEKNEVATLKTELLRANNDTDANISGRRMMPEFVTTTSRVKDKLLSYLEDTFNEVERKIKPLTNIKIALSNDDHYRIGYIIATIDTLEVNLKKLKNDMNLHQHFWDDEKILDLFDRIKATNTVATSLIESLRKYLPKH